MLLNMTRPAGKCSCCDLVFVDPDVRMIESAERARYLLHQNSLEDKQYVAFLLRLADPICTKKPRPASVLDFGSGPSPIMAEILEKRGYNVSLFDSHFAPDELVLSARYDIVLCCETAEHFHDAAAEWKKMVNCLREDGVLGVMTLLHDENTDWKHWWYAHDPTHACFYSARTMTWIGKRFGLETSVLDERVTVFSK